MYLMCMVCLCVHTHVYKHEIETAAGGLFVCLFERETWMTSHRSELRRFRSTGEKKCSQQDGKARGLGEEAQWWDGGCTRAAFPMMGPQYPPVQVRLSSSIWMD